jgi:biopolymer transport protein ExbD
MFSYNDDELFDLSIDLTPLLDIIFILLLFYIVASTFTQSYAVKVELPQSEAEAAAEEAMQVVTINKDGTFLLDEQPVKDDELEKRLAAAPSDQPLLFSIDKETAFERFVFAVDQAKKSGRENFSVHVQK